MPNLLKPHRPALVDREHFRLLAAKEHDPEDPYYYRFDPVFNFGKTSPLGFHLPRQNPDTTYDQAALAPIFDSLPEEHGVYRLGWWTSWKHCAGWISCAQPHDKVIISRIRKEDLAAIPGVQICADRILLDRAIMSFTVEPLSDANKDFSSLVLPFEKMEYLYTEFGWNSARPVEVANIAPPEKEWEPEAIPEDDIPWALTLHSLASGVMSLYNEIDRSNFSAYEYGDAARAALQAAGVRCGSTDRLQMLKVLAWVAGSWYHEPDPERVSSGLLYAACRECKRLGRPWHKGRAELRRRADLKGLHRIIWSLRNRGLLSMNPNRRVGDREPMFP